MQLNTRKSLGLTAVALCLAAVGLGAAIDPAAVEKSRGDYFHSIGKAMKALVGEIKKPDGDMGVIRASAAQIDSLAPQLPSHFPAGSGPQPGLKTEAKAEVWAKPEEFAKDAAAFKIAAANLDTAAKGGDIGAIRSATMATGQACKTCHDTFRHEDQ